MHYAADRSGTTFAPVIATSTRGRRKMKYAGLLLAGLFVGAAPLAGQSASSPVGAWRVEASTDTRGGPREVVIRPDSSATWGKETSRWRLVGDSIRVAIGGEWETYKLKVTSNQLTISGGDLPKPITLKRAGPATPRPAGVEVPPVPEDG
jgi:hypothetical protein